MVGRALNVIPVIPRGVFLVGLAYALILLSAPAISWLIVWRPWRREVRVPVSERPAETEA